MTKKQIFGIFIAVCGVVLLIGSFVGGAYFPLWPNARGGFYIVLLIIAFLLMNLGGACFVFGAKPKGS